MQVTTINRTTSLVKRSAQNYPAVCKELGNEIKDQAVTTTKSVLDLLRLMAKGIGILTFPLWILPLALGMYLTFRVIESQATAYPRKIN